MLRLEPAFTCLTCGEFQKEAPAQDSDCQEGGCVWVECLADPEGPPEEEEEEEPSRSSPVCCKRCPPGQCLIDAWSKGQA